MRSTNPVLGENVFSQSGAFADGQVMTIQGTVNKCLILLALVLVPALWVWSKIIQPAAPSVGYETPAAVSNPAAVIPFIFGGVIVGLIAALITVFKKEWARVTAPIYAVAEGLVLGGISAILEMRYHGIVMQAVGLTFGMLFCLLMAYKARIIRVTEKFRAGVVIATGAIALLYLVTWILGMFHVNMPYIHDSGPIGIGISLFIVGIAALNLLLDFDFIEQGAEVGAPKYMEWYGAFGLMVTLIWLYMEILNLLAKLRGRD
ncbi:MAG: Bax inhibitor-1/YccA family protein [Candidatus Omnitrophica bacterium]|nr:Bax inhibitor-1/YccA family protein [Candidatus Omnitrophota bacterium]